MERADAEALLDRLHRAQNRHYAGGDDAELRMEPRELLVGAGDHVASRTDGTATIDGVEHRWCTVGLYRICDGQVQECWLLPLEPDTFDLIWSSR